MQSVACVHVDVARSVRPRRNTRWITDVETASESLHLFVAGSVVVLVPLVGRVVGGDEDRREARGDETALDLEPERIRVEDLEHLLELHLALELFEHDALLSDVPVPPEARVAHVDHVDVREHVVHRVALADTSRADDSDDLEVVAARWRSERSELEAAARVLEEDSRIDCADVPILHEGGCCGCEIGALSASLGEGTDLPRSFETPLCLGAVRLVLLGVALRLDEMRALEDSEDYALRSLAGDLL